MNAFIYNGAVKMEQKNIYQAVSRRTQQKEETQAIILESARALFEKMGFKKTTIRASTQEHLPFTKIENDLAFLKDGTCCLVLQTTAINFGLLSEREQEATIFAYAGFLNSLAFPVQIVIHSRQKDISAYLSLINQEIKKKKSAFGPSGSAELTAEASSRGEKLKTQLEKYRQFIEKTVRKNKILDKSNKSTSDKDVWGKN